MCIDIVDFCCAYVLGRSQLQDCYLPSWIRYLSPVSVRIYDHCLALTRILFLTVSLYRTLALDRSQPQDCCPALASVF